MIKNSLQKNQVVVYQAKSGAIELRGDAEKETIWATQAQIADVFEIDRSVVTKHIGNILKLKEVDEKSNVQKMHIGNSDKQLRSRAQNIALLVDIGASHKRRDRHQYPVEIIHELSLTMNKTMEYFGVLKNVLNFC